MYKCGMAMNYINRKRVGSGFDHWVSKFINVKIVDIQSVDGFSLLLVYVMFNKKYFNTRNKQNLDLKLRFVFRYYIWKSIKQNKTFYERYMSVEKVVLNKVGILSFWTVDSDFSKYFGRFSEFPVISDWFLIFVFFIMAFGLFVLLLSVLRKYCCDRKQDRKGWLQEARSS